MEELKYHWSNPKFNGKPWAIEESHKKKKPQKQRKVKECTKKGYSELEARKEMFILCCGEHKDFFGRLRRWAYEQCRWCGMFHIVRLK